MYLLQHIVIFLEQYHIVFATSLKQGQPQLKNYEISSYPSVLYSIHAVSYISDITGHLAEMFHKKTRFTSGPQNHKHGVCFTIIKKI